MTWQMVEPGHYKRGDWTIRRVDRKPDDRPWLLVDERSVDTYGGSRHHTLVLAKRSADNWDAVRAGRRRP